MWERRTVCSTHLEVAAIVTGLQIEQLQGGQLIEGDVERVGEKDCV